MRFWLCTCSAEGKKKKDKTLKTKKPKLFLVQHVSSSAIHHSSSIWNVVPEEESEKWNTFFGGWGGEGELGALKALKKCTKSFEGCCVRVSSSFISVEAVWRCCTVLFYQCVLESAGRWISLCVFCLCECVTEWVCGWERGRDGRMDKQTGTGCANVWCVFVFTEACCSLLPSCFASLLVLTRSYT